MATTKVDVKLIDASSISDAKYLKGDGTWAAIAAGGGFAGVKVYTATSSTWTKADRETTLGVTITKVVVEVQGAGGSGSRGTTGGTTMGGAGGGYAKKFLDVSNTTTATAAVGSGGTSITSTGVGVAGGLSSFVELVGTGGWDDVVGNGGAAGNNSGFGAAATAVGGTGEDGDINIQGGNGQSAAMGYYAGGSFLGIAGKNQDATTATEAAALGFGAGGGGGHNQDSGIGAPGIVIVWEYQ